METSGRNASHLTALLRYGELGQYHLEVEGVVQAKRIKARWIQRSLE